MKSTAFLYALSFAFVVGVIVGGFLFILFQGYVFILVIIGFITFVTKALPILIRVFCQDKGKANVTN
jgi:uncharacterized membrane protein YoaK (UPF0700 family)